MIPNTISKEYTYHNHWIGAGVILIILSGMANIILSIPHAPLLFQNFGQYYEHLSHHNIHIYSLLHRVVGFILILIAHSLYKRMEMAWNLTIITLTTSISLKLVRFHEFISPMLVVEIVLLMLFLYYRKQFCRKSDGKSLRRALIIGVGSIVLMIAVSSLGFFAMKKEYRNLHSLSDAIVQSVKILFLMDVSGVSQTKLGERYLDMTIFFNWGFILTALIYVLKPVVYDPVIRTRDRQKVSELVEQYGENPMSYLALEADKKYFFGKSVDGVIAFGVVSDVATVCGDMICSQEESGIFLSEFIDFCRQNHYSILFLNTTERFANLYQAMGFGQTKYGEDACFLLSDYNLAGGKVAKVRAAINHANKEGITVSEYQPKKQREPFIEKEIKEISQEWLAGKNSGELSFMLGGIGLVC